VATSDKGVVEVYKKSDFELPKKKKETNQAKAYQKAIDNRFNRLENLIGKLVEKSASKDNSKKEQNIDEKLDRIEKLLEEVSVKETVYTKYVDEKVVEVEELEAAFIPEVDVSDMKMSSSGAKVLDQDSDDLEDTASLLSGLTKKEAK
jgi:ribosome assembly protein YihI (activator of Der GTPase)